MGLSEKAVKDFQQRYTTYYQEEISDSNARILADSFMQFVKGNVKYYLGKNDDRNKSRPQAN